MLHLRLLHQHLRSDLYCLQPSPHIIEEEAILDQLLAEVAQEPCHAGSLLDDNQQVLEDALDDAGGHEALSRLVGRLEEKIEQMQRKRGEEVSGGLVVVGGIESPLEDTFEQLEVAVVGVLAFRRDVLH